MGWTVHSVVIVSFQLDISGVPGKPRITNTEKEIESSFTLTWSRPTDDGGDDNIKYQVEWGKRPITDKTEHSVVENIPDTFHKIENLEHGVEYEFRVMAKNQAGAGEADIKFFTVKGSTGMYTIETKYVNFEREFELGNVLQSIIKYFYEVILFKSLLHQCHVSKWQLNEKMLPF